MSTDEFELPIKQKHPKTYIPVKANKIEKGKSYASIMVNDQKTMLANLRWLRQQMDKEERQLKIMKDTLYDRSLPTRWTPYNKMEGFDRDAEDNIVSCMPPPKHLPNNPSNLSRAHKIEYGKLHANVLVNDQIAMMENLRRLRRQISKDDRQVDIFNGKKPSYQKKTSGSACFSNHPIRSAKSEFRINRIGLEEYDDEYRMPVVKYDYDTRRSVAREYLDSRSSVARDFSPVRSAKSEFNINKITEPYHDNKISRFRAALQEIRATEREKSISRKSIPKEVNRTQIRESIPREIMNRKSVPRDKSVSRDMQVCRYNPEDNDMAYEHGPIYRRILKKLDDGSLFDKPQYDDGDTDTYHKGITRKVFQNNGNREFYQLDTPNSRCWTMPEAPDEYVQAVAYEKDNESSDARFGLTDDGRSLLRMADMFCDNRSGKW